MFLIGWGSSGSSIASVKNMLKTLMILTNATGFVALCSRNPHDVQTITHRLLPHSHRHTLLWEKGSHTLTSPGVSTPRIRPSNFYSIFWDEQHTFAALRDTLTHTHTHSPSTLSALFAEHKIEKAHSYNQCARSLDFSKNWERQKGRVHISVHSWITFHSEAHQTVL